MIYRLMRPSIPAVLTVLVLSGCTLQEVQKFSYNTGAAIGCRHANDNLPNEKQLDLDCLETRGEGMSYEKYIELRNEVDSK